MIPWDRSRTEMKSNSDIMNARDAADFLKAHVETIRRLARRGEIPAFKVGKDWRFHREALLTWTKTWERLDR
jgi:excisionase family DNA binding protein